MDSIETLINYYNKSNEKDMYHQVVEHILRNIHKVGNISIYDLADLCYSSPSTISRLVKKLDFDNYADFKSKITYALQNYKYLNQNMREPDLVDNDDVISLYFNFLINNIAYLQSEIDREQIKAISDQFHLAEQIFFYSYPQVQVDILQKSLIISGKHSYVYERIPAQEASLDKITSKSVVMAIIPNLLEMGHMRTILKKTKDKGAFVITICSSKKNDYKKYSDIQISFDGTKTSMDLYLFMVLTNIIKSDYCHRYLNNIIENLYD